MAERDRIYRPVRKLDAEHKAQAKKAIDVAKEALREPNPDTFLGRKTQEPGWVGTSLALVVSGPGGSNPDRERKRRATRRGDRNRPPVSLFHYRARIASATGSKGRECPLSDCTECPLRLP